MNNKIETHTKIAIGFAIAFSLAFIFCAIKGCEDKQIRERIRYYQTLNDR